MEKLFARFRKGDNLLKIYQKDGKTGQYLRGIMYKFKWDASVSPNKSYLGIISAANFYEKDGDMSEYRVREYFGMTAARPVSSDNYIDKNHRVIWTNNDYDEWKEACMEYNDISDEETSYERYLDYCSDNLDDERFNLDVPVNGVIIAFADMGMWDGRCVGCDILGDKVKDILKSNCDYLDWYCDQHNVRCEAIHHDGTNNYLYRVANTREQAENIKYKVINGEMTEEQFRKATRSLKPYVGQVYGW